VKNRKEIFYLIINEALRAYLFAGKPHRGSVPLFGGAQFPEAGKEAFRLAGDYSLVTSDPAPALGLFMRRGIKQKLVF